MWSAQVLGSGLESHLLQWTIPARKTEHLILPDKRLMLPSWRTDWGVDTSSIAGHKSGPVHVALGHSAPQQLLVHSQTKGMSSFLPSYHPARANPDASSSFLPSYHPARANPDASAMF